MKNRLGQLITALSCGLVTASTLFAQAKPAEPTVVIAEGEFFKSQGDGWKPTHQDYSLASHTYGGMWVSNGGLLGIDPKSAGKTATLDVQIPVAGSYRVWSKYQAPPYFNYMHKIEVIQNGKTVFTYDYGKELAPKFYSFFGAYGLKPAPAVWWFWGVDHDAAEAPAQGAALAAGTAQIKITALDNPAPAGDRFIDFVVLTTEQQDTFKGFKPYGTGSPFMLEAIANTKLYARFKHSLDKPTQLKGVTAGHMQPLYGGQTGTFPSTPVEPGQWSPWFNIASICRMAHEEGVWLSLTGAAAKTRPSFEVEVSRDPEGKDIVGRMPVLNGEAIILPIDIAWNKQSVVKTSKQHAEEIIKLSKTQWRTANGGKKPQTLAVYGAFRASNPADQAWVDQFKDALGYNTQLPDSLTHLQHDGYHQHSFGIANIQAFAGKLTQQQKDNFRILSFGDEIHVAAIDATKPDNNAGFRQWLAAQNLTAADLGGVDPKNANLEMPAAALPAKQAFKSPEIAWYSTLYSEVKAFEEFRQNTLAAEKAIGPKVWTGANYSPHGAPQYYGPIFQWVDMFKHKGMSAFWTEDYIFSVPESPQIISWMFATAHAGAKYNNTPIHFYVMPHAPGQVPEYLRKSMVFAVGAGSADIDSFWVGPAESFTENFVSWAYPDSFKALHESIYDAGEVEDISVSGKRRQSKVAVVLSKATDFNEKFLPVDPKSDPMSAKCSAEFGGYQQTLCRKEAQMLYLSLRQAQQQVDLITEDDIKDGILKNYKTVYFAGEWVDNKAVPKIAQWVKDGGVLYASAGMGHLNQFNKPEASLLEVLGLKAVGVTKRELQYRTLLELPIVKPVGTITMGADKFDAIAMIEKLTPGSAKVLGNWADGSAAVTVNELGKGKAYAVAGLPGAANIKAATRPVPFARGGYLHLYTPINLDPKTNKLARLGIDNTAGIAPEVTASDARVETLLTENDKGTLVSLINWSDDKKVSGLKVAVKSEFKPGKVWSTQLQKSLPFEYKDKTVTFSIDMTDADFVTLRK
jgi:hypothetical protein